MIVFDCVMLISFGTLFGGSLGAWVEEAIFQGGSAFPFACLFQYSQHQSTLNSWHVEFKSSEVSLLTPYEGPCASHASEENAYFVYGSITNAEVQFLSIYHGPSTTGSFTYQSLLHQVSTMKKQTVHLLPQQKHLRQASLCLWDPAFTPFLFSMISVPFLPTTMYLESPA